MIVSFMRGWTDCGKINSTKVDRINLKVPSKVDNIQYCCDKRASEKIKVGLVEGAKPQVNQTYCISKCHIVLGMRNGYISKYPMDTNLWVVVRYLAKIRIVERG